MPKTASCLTLTRSLAFAAGMDAANRAMRTRLGQKPKSPARWTVAEHDIATATTNKLLLHVPCDQGGLAGIELTPTMRADLGLAA